jgi:hypothetical protein
MVAVEVLSDDALLLGLRRISLLICSLRQSLLSHDHRSIKSAAAIFYTEKPKQHAGLALLGAFYFGLYDSQTAHPSGALTSPKRRKHLCGGEPRAFSQTVHRKICSREDAQKICGWLFSS